MLSKRWTRPLLSHSHAVSFLSTLWMYCRTRFDSDSLNAATKIIAIVVIHYRNSAQYIMHVYGSCLLIYGITIVRLLSFLFSADFEQNANIYGSIKSSSTVVGLVERTISHSSNYLGSYIWIRKVSSADIGEIIHLTLFLPGVSGSVG